MVTYSRLQRRSQKETKQRTILLLGASVVLLILALVFGVPLLFQLTGAISGFAGKRSENQQNVGIKPSIPVFEESLEATGSARTEIMGIADPKTTIELFQNDNPKGTEISNDEGKFLFQVTLSEGKNEFTAQAVSDTGQKSDISNRYIITLLTARPKLEVESPTDGVQVNEKDIQVKGKTDPRVSVTINDRLEIMDGNGNFSGYYTLSEGDNKIKITATDLAGNSTTKEIMVKFSP